MAAQLLCVLGAGTAGAQQIVVRVGDESSTGVAPGGQVSIPIVVDMSAAAPLDLASITFDLNWTPSLLSFVSASPDTFGTVVFNDTQTDLGVLTTSMFNVTGATTTFTLATVVFDATSSVPAEGQLAPITIDVTTAGDELGASVLGSLIEQSLQLCIGIGGLFGDVSGDGVVNIIDAQQVARFSIGLPPPPDPERTVLLGDVTEDGAVNIIDAQQIARFSVGLPTTGAPRIGETLAVCPEPPPPPPPTQYDIEVRFLTPATSSQTEAFANSAARWESLIVGDVPDFSFEAMPLPAGACGVAHPTLSEVVDDLLIYVLIEVIDGPGGILGSAGPCALRDNWQSIVGVMRFDIADVPGLEASGQFEAVILHEMAHVIGLGIVWDVLGLLVNPSLPSSPGVDTHFIGPRAIVAFDDVGGTGYTAGEKVPVENEQGGGGTRDSHWRESVFDNELMTGFLNAGANPLSVVTVESFADIGYVIDPTGADSYTLPAAAGRSPVPGPKLELNDIWRGPLFKFDASGRMISVTRR